MEPIIDLDEPLEAQLGEHGLTQPPQNESCEPCDPRRKPNASPPLAVYTKRLRLPLIGNRPANFQLQLLAIAFLFLLVMAAAIAVMESRTSANRAVHLAVAAEIGILAERIDRLALSAASEGGQQIRQELNGTREREAGLIAALDRGGNLDGKAVAPVDAALRPALDTAKKYWLPYDKAVQAMFLLPAAADPTSSEMPTDPQPALNQYYLQYRDALTQLRIAAADALGQRRNRAVMAALGAMAMLTLLLFFRVFSDDAATRQQLLVRQRRQAEEENAETQQAMQRLMDEMDSLAAGDFSARVGVADGVTATIGNAMNHAIEELSLLVTRINDVARRMATASGEASHTAEEALAAGEMQAQEIRRVSGQVLSMAQSMNAVSGKAEQSAAAARRLLDAARTLEKPASVVAEGEPLTATAARALSDISTPLRQITELVELIELTEGIFSDTRQQTEVALRVAQALREILRIAEQTGSATRSTAISISEIADLGVELKGFIAGFKA